MIINVYPEDEAFGRIPRDALAAVNILLTDRQRRLLIYYACQKNGFSPAGKTVELYTGISPKHLSGIRKKLIEMGFISYQKGSRKEQGRIEIHWSTIIEKSRSTNYCNRSR